MKRKALYIIAWICCCTCFPAMLCAQVLFKTSIDRDNILIGEPIQLTLDARIPLGQPVEWFPLDSLPHFEIMSKGPVDTIESVDGKKIVQVLTITSYDSGHWQVPRLSLKVNNEMHYSDTLGVDVRYSADFDPAKDYRDIKEIVEVENPGNNKIPWIIGAATLVAIALLIYFLRRKKKMVAAPAVAAVVLSPYEEAMKALNDLRSKISAMEVKAYYTRLNDILRLFVLRKLKLATLEKTNEELIVQLKQLPMDKDAFQQLATALRMADFVKFARYQPQETDNQQNFTIIQSAITTLNNIS